ncbi:hypothetical protein [Litorilituus sediminis]|uniref:Uncharacterized protein n=1 Tax=Litorilituus sediminis TaxID=718192 RepID=A0A4P6PBU0_9GAMM|nr:hypothetical protein [Litorilituus sediminis]QBG37117.1 hypothetical protein EMK97_15965 [Litorilituus sediminis]
MKKVILSLVIICLGVGLFIWLQPIDTDQQDNSAILQLALPKESITEVSHLSKSELQAAPVIKSVLPVEDKTDATTDERIEPYIYNCSDSPLENADIDEKKLVYFLSELAQSNNQEQRLIHTLFQQHEDISARYDALLAYNDEFPGQPYVMMGLIGFCSSGEVNCQADILSQAATADKDNGALWLTLANYYLSIGDIENGEQALNQVVSSIAFHDYIYDKVQLFMQIAKGADSMSFQERALIATGHLAAESLWLSHVAQYCQGKLANVDPDGQLCFDVGTVLESQGSNALVNLIGINFQLQQFEEKEQNTEKALLEQRKNNMLTLSGSDQVWQAEILKFYDEKLFNHWLANAVNYGEQKAQQLLIAEAIELSKNEYYNPCPAQ